MQNMTELTETMKALSEKMQAPRPQSSIDWGKQHKTGGLFVYPPMVTPYIPKEATVTAKAHERTGHAAFIRAYDKSHNPLVCPNCQGIGFVLLVLTSSGPFSSPSPMGVLTWFDGDELHGKGWYVIDRTMQYDCPECKKR
jgi:hypothetical protein